ERLGGDLELAIDLPGVLGVELGLELRLLLERLLHLLGREVRPELLVDLVELLQEVVDLGDGLLDVLAHVLLRVEPRLLADVADRQSLRGDDDAVRRLLLAGEDLEHRALPLAVSADEADVRSRQEAEGEALEDDALDVALAEILDGENRGAHTSGSLHLAAMKKAIFLALLLLGAGCSKSGSSYGGGSQNTVSFQLSPPSGSTLPTAAKGTAYVQTFTVVSGGTGP